MKIMFMEEDGDKTLTLFDSGEALVATSASHANFDTIYERVMAGATLDDVRGLFDRQAAAESMFEAFSERVSISNGQVFFDLEPVDNSLTKKVVEFIDEGLEDEAQALVNFFENVAANPQEHSREQLFRWLDRHDFPITPNGHIVAYKGVRKVGEGQYTSISTGTAIVNGKTHTGAIPQAVGDVVEMPRSAVQHDPSVGCHTGLHAGTWAYAHNFAQGATLEVHINPRDVVSVPTDCDDQKVRVCRYSVVGVLDQPYAGAFVDDADDDEYDEDDDFNSDYYEGYDVY